MTHGMSLFPSVALNILERYLFPSVAFEENSAFPLLVQPFFPECFMRSAYIRCLPRANKSQSTTWRFPVVTTTVQYDTNPLMKSVETQTQI
jgi:hypothetical protein